MARKYYGPTWLLKEVMKCSQNLQICVHVDVITVASRAAFPVTAFRPRVRLGERSGLENAKRQTRIRRRRKILSLAARLGQAMRGPARRGEARRGEARKPDRLPSCYARRDTSSNPRQWVHRWPGRACPVYLFTATPTMRRVQYRHQTQAFFSASLGSGFVGAGVMPAS